MPLVKFANAAVIHPQFSPEGWQRVRTAARRNGNVSVNLVEQASGVFDKPFNPADYLLTHATIIASVETQEVPNAKLGSTVENGFRVNRKWLDYWIKTSTQKYINNNCFVPGTPITMADGTIKSIEKVRVGDEVLTHKGRARRVTNTFRRDVDEELLEVTVRGSNERLFVTAEHPFFAFRHNQECVACGETFDRQHHTISHLLGKHYCSKQCYYQHRVSNADLLKEKQGEFLEAQDLTTSDFASTPVVTGEQDVGLTLGQARLVGLFAAEGYYELNSRNNNERVGVCWAFHEEEWETLAQTVCDLMWSEFKIECVVRPHRDDRGIQVTTKTCRDAVEFFSSFVLGEGATDKRLCGGLIKASPAVQMEILRGWFEGDGSAFDTGIDRRVPGDFRLAGSSSSQSLANQMRVLLHRVGVAPRIHHTVSEGRRRLVIDGAVRVVSDPSKECHSWVVSCGAGYLEELVQGTVYEDVYQQASEARDGFQQTPQLRFLNGYVLQMVTSLEPVAYRGPVYNFETEEDHSYIVAGVAVHNCDSWSRPVILKSYRTFVGAHNFVEHVQIEDLSKGRIIDAAARDIGDAIYVDILIATDRQHEPLIQAIENGKMGTLSMGCTVDNTTCTKCGHVAADETEMCSCVKYEKGNTFYDQQGNRRIVAELCGHESLDPTAGVQFIEASWVGTPAFTGAVTRNILEPSANISRRAQEILALPPKKWDAEAQLKAASAVYNGDLVLGQWDDEDEEDEEGGGEEVAPPLKQLEDDLAQHMLDRVKKRIRRDMQHEDAAGALNPEESSMAPNDNIVKEAASMEAVLAGAGKVYQASLHAIVRTASSDAHLLDGVAALNQSLGIAVPVQVYRSVLAAGDYDPHNPRAFLRACHRALGRKPTKAEVRTMIRLGKLISRRGAAAMSSLPLQGEETASQPGKTRRSKR